MVKQVKALMALRGVSRSELSRMTGVSAAAVSRFLKEETELRSEALVKILDVLGADIDRLVSREITKALGQADELSLGEDFGFLLDKTDPITRRTITDTLISSFKSTKSPELKSRITRLKRYRESIKTVRRTPC